LFRGALARSGDERDAWLNEQCGDDAELLAEVRVLLETDESSEDFLETPALGANFDVGTASTTMPERIGPYKVLRVLGEGGMGVVYEAEQAEPKRRVAIKLVRGGIGDDEVLRRFRYEAELLGRLRDPRIAQIFEAGTDELGRPYFAMELVDGKPLTGSGELDVRARCQLMAEIADAVHHAHQRGVIHRDLKPGNVIVQKDGTPKVLDFGVARASDRDTRKTLFTSAGQIIGTPAYMSPEQASGDPDRVDVRTDVYALGAMAFELLGGKPPIDVEGMAPLEAVTAVREREPAKLSSILREARGDLDTIVNKALAKEPDRRYTSAAELAADLRRYLNDEPVIARPTTIGYQLTKFARRNRALVGASALALVALVAATIVSVAFAVQAERARDAEQAARAQAEQDRDTAVGAREAEQEQRELAEERFNDVRQLARTLIFDIERRLRDVPGATSARERLISVGVRYLDALSRSDEADADLLAEVAEGYVRIHDVQGGSTGSSLGDTEAAMASLEKSKAIRRRLLEQDPSSERDRIWLSVTLKFETELLQTLGRNDEGLERLEEAESLARAMLEDNPQNTGAMRDLMLTTGLRGDVLLQIGRNDAGLEALLSAVEQAARLAEMSPTPRPLRDLAVAQTDAGRALGRLGRDDEALAMFEASYETRRRALETNPDSARARRDVIIVAERTGDLEMGRGRHAEALEWYERAQALAERALSEDPEDRLAAYTVTVMLESVTDVLIELGRLDEAMAAAERNVRMRRVLTELDPGNLRWLIAVGVAVERSGRVHEAAERNAEAATAFEEAYEVAGRVIESDPGASLAYHSRVYVSHRLGALAMKSADRVRAIEWIDRALATLDEMEARSMQAMPALVSRETLAAQRAQASDL
ncbi:MAG: serine/threonine-protein kinase, partial [Planctomycetota bacterium]